MSFFLGKYRHYKGQDYEALYLAKLEATEEDVVVYRSLYGKQEIWVRPLAVFTEMVEIEGQLIPRFQKVEE